jgi:hypothetical protein
MIEAARKASADRADLVVFSEIDGVVELGGCDP